MTAITEGRYTKLGVVAAGLLALLFLASACGGNAGGSSRSPEAGGLSAQGQKANTAPAQSEPTKAAAPAKQGGTGTTSAREMSEGRGRSVVEIQSAAANSKFLDARHLKAGLSCEGCHGTLPAEGAPTAPETAKCLSCHGGSFTSLALKTAALGDKNPHGSHEGELDCAKCHNVHRAFEYYCNTCHSFAVPKRFQTD